MRMPNYSHVVALVLAAMLPLVGAEVPAIPTKKKDKVALVREEAAPLGGVDSVGTMIPEGFTNLKVRVPSFNQGKCTSLLTADTLVRNGANILHGEKVTIRMYREPSGHDLRIDLKTADYLMDKKSISSKDRSRVSEQDFFVEGDTMTFDTVTGKGSMVGHVHMVIYNADAFGKRPAAAPAAIQPVASAVPAIAPAAPVTATK
jgi:hypothetical protein